MNPSAIYSKSGKGVQEAAGKTSLLSRPDRAVLAAIDGRATLADVAQKIGKTFDATFQGLITKLDKDGFIREVSAGTAAPVGTAPKPAARAPARPAAAAPADPASDLDFSMLGGPSKPAPAPSKPAAPAKAAPPPRPAAPPPPPPPPPKEQESALFKARQEAEAKAQAERDRSRKEAEDRFRAETEAKLRAEAEAKARAEAEAKVAAEAEAKVKAAREAALKAAAEAKAKAEAEAKRAREEAEQARREAEEKAERVRREAEEKAERERKAREEAERIRKEAEERERKAREEAERIRKEAEERERKAREEAERARKALEEERRKMEEERRRREEEDLERKAKEEEERAERRRRDEEAEQERRRKREEEESQEAAEREARRKAREEEEAREAAEREARRKAREEEEAAEEARAAEERAAKKAKKKDKEPEKPRRAEPEKAEASGGGFADSLMADLDSFNTREEEESKAKEEAERKEREERERRAREEAERREKEEAERRAKEEKQRAKEEREREKREEKERLRKEEEEEKERIRIEEEKREREAEERKRKAKEEEALARKAQSSGVGGYVSEDQRRKRQLDVGPRDPSLVRRPQRSWGKPVAITLFFLLLAALGIAHVMPIATIDYERAASEAIGRPVRIGSARLWLLSGLQLRFENVSAGDVKIGRVTAHPTLSSLTEPRKAFSSIELDRVSVPQDALGQLLFARAKGDNFVVARVIARKLELPGPLAMPASLEAELTLDANGAVRAATLRGDQGLVARLDVQGPAIEFALDAASFTLPFAPEVSFSQFGMKGSANAQGMQIKQWDGQALSGSFTGTARVRWGGTWTVDGVITARGINAAVFAPALLSEGRGEGTGKFVMSGVEPGKLSSGARLDGSFTINKGVLGSFDLSRAIQTGGKQAQGRTQFTEMNGQVSYDGGEVELRNITIGAGALNAGASAVISPKGALTGRIVADVRTASQVLRATLLLGGTVKEPQVRN